MILICGKPIYERLDEYFDKRKERKLDWHRYFTLVPRRIDNNRCVWLQFVERRGSIYTFRSRLPESSITADFYGWRYEYRIGEEIEN